MNLKTKKNPKGKWQGSRDPHLSKQGHIIAEHTGKELRRLHRSYGGRRMPIKKIISSPLNRALSTAEDVSVQLGGVPIETDPNLIERNYGKLENKSKHRVAPSTRAKIESSSEADMNEIGEKYNVESLSGVRKRVMPAIRKHIADNPDSALVVVSHYSPTVIGLNDLMGRNLSHYTSTHMPTGSISIVDVDKSGRAETRVLAHDKHMHDLPQDPTRSHRGEMEQWDSIVTRKLPDGRILKYSLAGKDLLDFHNASKGERIRKRGMDYDVYDDLFTHSRRNRLFTGPDGRRFFIQKSTPLSGVSSSVKRGGRNQVRSRKDGRPRREYYVKKLSSDRDPIPVVVKNPLQTQHGDESAKLVLSMKKDEEEGAKKIREARVGINTPNFVCSIFDPRKNSLQSVRTKLDGVVDARRLYANLKSNPKRRKKLLKTLRKRLSELAEKTGELPTILRGDELFLDPHFEKVENKVYLTDTNMGINPMYRNTTALLRSLKEDPRFPQLDVDRLDYKHAGFEAANEYMREYFSKLPKKLKDVVHQKKIDMMLEEVKTTTRKHSGRRGIRREEERLISSNFPDSAWARRIRKRARERERRSKKKKKKPRK
jgi:broad specificity phosphatase PhoE